LTFGRRPVRLKEAKKDPIKKLPPEKEKPGPALSAFCKNQTLRKGLHAFCRAQNKYSAKNGTESKTFCFPAYGSRICITFQSDQDNCPDLLPKALLSHRP
jgi:hypothetical protein